MDWFDKPSSHRLLWKLLWISCALTLAAQLIHHFAASHPGTHHFAVQNYLFFYAALGFVACALSIVAAKLVGHVLKKPEQFYGEPAHEPLPDVENPEG